MKKFLAIAVAVVMIAAVCSTVSFAASEPALLITAEQLADESNLTTSNNVEIELKEENGVKFARITATGGDPHFYFGTAPETDVANKYAAIKYRTTTSGLTIDAYMAGAEPHTIFGEVNGDGNWNFLVGDLSQSGANWTGKFARFDPLNGNVAAGDVLDVEWIAVFADQADAEAYRGSTGSSSEQPATSEKSEDQYLCVDPDANGSVGQHTGWWMNPINGPDEKYITINFKANGSFKGVKGYYLTNPASAEVGPTVVKAQLLDASGNLLEEKEVPVDGDAWYETVFSKTYGAGTYAVKFVAVSGGGGWFVLGSAQGSDENVTIDHNCNTNADTLPYPAMALIGAEAAGEQPSQPSNPQTADAAIVAIAAVACIALAGAVIAKKVK